MAGGSLLTKTSGKWWQEDASVGVSEDALLLAAALQEITIELKKISKRLLAIENKIMEER